MPPKKKSNPSSGAGRNKNNNNKNNNSNTSNIDEQIVQDTYATESTDKPSSQANKRHKNNDSGTETMEVDNTTPRASSPNTQFFDNLENSSNIDSTRNAQQPQQPESQGSTSTSATSKIGNLHNASDASFNKEISPLSNVSQHDKNQHVSSQDTNMEYSENDVIKADTTTFLAAVPFNEIKKPDETNRQTYDRLNDYFVTKFSSFLKFYTTGKVSDNSKKLVIRLGDKEEYDNLINTQDAVLKTAENADIPQFLSYNPSAIKAEQNTRSIHVRDILLFIKESEI
jgi:hypothetical protein